MPSVVPHLQPQNNAYHNPFGTEVGLLRTSEGGMSRMAVSWDMPAAGGERGRVYGQKKPPDATPVSRPPLPPGMQGLAAVPVTLAANQTDGVLTIEADQETATEGTLANLVVRATMSFNGDAAVDQPITLKVVP